jgi:hypothetical protein
LLSRCHERRSEEKFIISLQTMSISFHWLCLNDVDPQDDDAQIANLAVSTAILCIFNLGTLIVFIRAWHMHRKWTKAGGKSWYMQRHMITLFIAALTLSLPAAIAWCVLFLHRSPNLATHDHEYYKPQPLMHAGSCRCIFGSKQSGSQLSARNTTLIWSTIILCSSWACPCFVLCASPCFL